MCEVFMYTVIQDIKITDLFNPIKTIEYKGEFNFKEYESKKLYMITLCNVSDKVIMFYKKGFTRDPKSFNSITSVVKSIFESDRYHITIKCDYTTIEGLAEIINSEDVLEYLLDLNCV